MLPFADWYQPATVEEMFLLQEKSFELILVGLINTALSLRFHRIYISLNIQGFDAKRYLERP